jgi:hypothetical protein
VERAICGIRCETKSVCRLLYSILSRLIRVRLDQGPFSSGVPFHSLAFVAFSRLSIDFLSALTFDTRSSPISCQHSLAPVYQDPTTRLHTHNCPSTVTCLLDHCAIRAFVSARPIASDTLAGLSLQSPSVCLCMKTPAPTSWFDHSMV